jgi:hypothetical protein
MEAMPRILLWLLALLVLLPAATACGGSNGSDKAKAPAATQGNQPASAPVCPPAWRPGWQRLADRIHAPVYCPSWLPDPLTGELGGPWQGMDSILKDRSYLMGFIWYEANVAEVHVNFRGYPGRTSIPRCNGKPCFNDSIGKKRVASFDVETFTVNRGADTWHVLYAWRDDGSLYTVSQHVVPDLGLSYRKVVANLDRMMGGLVRIAPQQS